MELKKEVEMVTEGGQKDEDVKLEGLLTDKGPSPQELSNSAADFIPVLEEGVY